MFMVSCLLVISALVQGLNGAMDFQDADMLHSIPKSELLDFFNSLGDQMMYLWNKFLNFHRCTLYLLSLQFWIYSCLLIKSEIKVYIGLFLYYTFNEHHNNSMHPHVRMHLLKHLKRNLI